MISKQAVIVISGFNIRAVIAFCRWATAHDINYHIVAKSDRDPIFLTIYKERVEIIRDSPSLKPEDFRSWIEALRNKYGYHRILVLPTSEFFNRFLLKHRTAIEDSDCVIPLVDSQLYSDISDKYKFAKLCESYGLDVPKEFSVIPEYFPFVAKPRTYSCSQGRQLTPYLIHDMDDLSGFLRKEVAGAYFYQQYIYGRSYYLLAYIAQKGTDVIFSQENLMQQAGGRSIILATTTDLHRTPVAQSYMDMLHNLNFSGLIMVELRRDESSDRYYMIESNPRLWGPMQFLIDNNIDVFGVMLRDYEFAITKPDPTHFLGSHYFWSGGIEQKSQPITYHNYSDEQFVKDLSVIRPQDIFLRGDTIDLFHQENKSREFL